jgi:hypothetical protein
MNNAVCEYARFARYRGQVYGLGEFFHIDPTMRLHQFKLGNWQGYQSDSYFSGVLVRYSADYDQCQLATYLS